MKLYRNKENDNNPETTDTSHTNKDDTPHNNRYDSIENYDYIENVKDMKSTNDEDE